MLQKDGFRALFQIAQPPGVNPRERSFTDGESRTVYIVSASLASSIIGECPTGVARIVFAILDDAYARALKPKDRAVWRGKTMDIVSLVPMTSVKRMILVAGTQV